MKEDHGDHRYSAQAINFWPIFKLSQFENFLKQTKKSNSAL
jgi:hypothetical protein